jgi:hypothetical protein
MSVHSNFLTAMPTRQSFFKDNENIFKNKYRTAATRRLCIIFFMAMDYDHLTETLRLVRQTG